MCVCVCVFSKLFVDLVSITPPPIDAVTFKDITAPEICTWVVLNASQCGLPMRTEGGTVEIHNRRRANKNGDTIQPQNVQIIYIYISCIHGAVIVIIVYMPHADSGACM